MRTLTETIEIFEDGISEVEAYDAVPDALHYLKEYRDYQLGIIKIGNDMEEAISKEFDDNPPLIWDELRQMVGKPVWVEYEGYIPDWEIIENVGATRGTVGDFTGNFIETHMSILHKEDLGKTWQAYRKERHENVG